MTLIRRTNPFGELLSLRQVMDRLFDDAWVRPRNGLLPDEQSLALDVRSTADTYEIRAALTAEPTRDEAIESTRLE